MPYKMVIHLKPGAEIPPAWRDNPNVEIHLSSSEALNPSSTPLPTATDSPPTVPREMQKTNPTNSHDVGGRARRVPLH